MPLINESLALLPLGLETFVKHAVTGYVRGSIGYDWAENGVVTLKIDPTRLSF